MPDSFATTADGLLLVANGIDPVMRWDGLADEMVEAGMQPPEDTLSLAFTGSGTITGTYRAYLRWVDDRGNVSNLSPVSSDYTVTDKATVTYSNVELPQLQSKVRRRQILRNTTGQARVYYVDVDTTDLTSTSFQSTKTDSTLQAQEAVALFDELNNDVSQRHAAPVDWKKFIASHHEYMFMAGEEAYDRGSVAVTFGSDQVVGHGTEWPSNFAGRFLWLPFAEEVYEIESVDEETQTITLTEALQGPTVPFTSYSIRPAAGNRRLVQFSEAGLPESWPITSAISPQEDGDDITGLMSKGSFLYILERRHIYRLTFQESPISDGFIFLTAGRGSVNNRTWQVIDDRAFMLDEAGVYSFAGGQQVEEISTPIQDLFEPVRGTRKPRYRIRWQAARWFHSVFDPGQRVIRWFVTLEGTGLPRHALCLDVARSSWWCEEYPFPVGASAVGPIRGSRRVFLGGPGGKVYVMGEGTLDLVDGQTQTVRGTVTSAGMRSLTDSQASFEDACVNAPVWIVSGTGKGQVRFITDVTPTRLSLNLPWNAKPDSTSVYQIGGVRYRYRTGWFRYASLEKENTRRLEIIFEPTESETLLDVRQYLDRSKTPVVWNYTQTATQADGFAVTKDDTDWVGSLTKENGLIQRRIDGQKELFIDGQRFSSWEFAGVTNTDEVTIYQISLEGVQGVRER